MDRVTREAELVALTREESALARKVRRLRRQLKLAQGELRAKRRHRKAVQAVMEQERAPDVFPSKLTNGATGYKLPQSDDPRTAEVDAATAAFVDSLDPIDKS